MTFNYKINVILANSQTGTLFLYLSPFAQGAIKQKIKQKYTLSNLRIKTINFGQ